MIGYSAEGFPELHEVYYERGGGDEEDLHERVVHGDEVHEEVEIPHAEHYQVQFLGLAGQAYIGGLEGRKGE